MMLALPFAVIGLALLALSSCAGATNLRRPHVSGDPS